MAQTELEKTLNRMKVTLKATELAGTPARGFSSAIRTWRVTLTREVKGEEKPLKLTLTLVCPVEPTLEAVVQCIQDDIADSDLTLWAFAQSYGIKGKSDAAIEAMYKTCKRVEARARRFFGDTKIIRSILGIAA